MKPLSSEYPQAPWRDVAVSSNLHRTPRLPSDSKSLIVNVQGHHFHHFQMAWDAPLCLSKHMVAIVYT